MVRMNLAYPCYNRDHLLYFSPPSPTPLPQHHRDKNPEAQHQKPNVHHPRKGRRAGRPELACQHNNVQDNQYNQQQSGRLFHGCRVFAGSAACGSVGHGPPAPDLLCSNLKK